MLQLQFLRPRNPDVLRQPLLPAIELRVRRQGSIRDHREQCPLDPESQFPPPRFLGDDLGQSETLPELLEDIDIAIRPRVLHTPARIIGDDLFRRTTPQDAARQLP